MSLLAYSLACIFIRSTFLSNCPSPTSTVVEITLRIKLLLTLLQMTLAPLGKDCKLSVLWQNLCARAVELEVGKNGKLLSEWHSHCSSLIVVGQETEVLLACFSSCGNTASWAVEWLSEPQYNYCTMSEVKLLFHKWGGTEERSLPLFYCTCLGLSHSNG